MLAVMEVVARCPNLSTLVCGHQNAELSSDNTEGVEKIMHVCGPVWSSAPLELKRKCISWGGVHIVRSPGPRPIF